jgi:Amidase
MTRWIQIVLYVVLGLALLRFGVVWTLQGLNLWGGSFMSGSPRWLVIGVVLVIAGITLLVQSGLLLRRRVRGWPEAMVTINPAAPREAEAADRALTDGRTTGPLHGIPIVVKDCLDTADMPTSFGSEIFTD